MLPASLVLVVHQAGTSHVTGSGEGWLLSTVSHLRAQSIFWCSLSPDLFSSSRPVPWAQTPECSAEHQVRLAASELVVLHSWIFRSPGMLTVLAFHLGNSSTPLGTEMC